jgi:hypothetical protein
VGELVDGWLDGDIIEVDLHLELQDDERELAGGEAVDGDGLLGEVHFPTIGYSIRARPV